MEGIKVPKNKNKLEVVNDERPKIGKASVNISQYYDALEGPLASSLKKGTFDGKRSTRSRIRKPSSDPSSSSSSSSSESGGDGDKYRGRKKGKKTPSTSSGSDRDDEKKEEEFFF